MKYEKGMTQNRIKGKYQICTNCIMDTSDPQISFNHKGECDFCTSFRENIAPIWHPDEQSRKRLLQKAEQIKKKTNGQKYNCIIGVSGGVDSSYLMYVASEIMGLNPLLYSIDTGWNLDLASENIKRISSKLHLDLHTEVADWEEMKDLQLAFLKSQVPYQDTPQDHVIFAGLYNYAISKGIKYVLTGGNYSTECVKPPFEWTYINDLKFIQDIHKRYGSKQIKDLPMCGMLKNRLYYRGIKGMKVVKPLDYVEYDQEKTLQFLESKFGYQRYKNKHYENIFTRWYEGDYLPKKFGYDKRRCYYSSLILTGQMSREEAIKRIDENPYDEEQAEADKRYIAEKLGITIEKMDRIVSGENKTWRDYKNQARFLNSFIHAAQRAGVEKRNFR